MKDVEFLNIKIKSLEKILEVANAQYADLKEENKILRQKLNNATETIRHLNNKLKNK